MIASTRLRALFPGLLPALLVATLAMAGCGGGDRRETGTTAPTLDPAEEEKAMEASADYYQGNPGEFPP